MRAKVFISLFFLIFLPGCSLSPVRVQGTAMLPNFKDGDRVLIDKNVEQLNRGEVVIFFYPKDTSKQYIKRIIGLPGEKIEIKDGSIFINGKFLEEFYVDQSYNQTKDNFPEKLISENNYFVLGDNRDNSSDSRYWGTVPKDLIIGKCYITY